MIVEEKGAPVPGGGFVKYNILGNTFIVPPKYLPPLNPIGRGAYGIVW